jgi:hypothetical protein
MMKHNVQKGILFPWKYADPECFQEQKNIEYFAGSTN